MCNAAAMEVTFTYVAAWTSFLVVQSSYLSDNLLINSSTSHASGCHPPRHPLPSIFMSRKSSQGVLVVRLHGTFHGWKPSFRTCPLKRIRAEWNCNAHDHVCLSTFLYTNALCMLFSWAVGSCYWGHSLTVVVIHLVGRSTLNNVRKLASTSKKRVAFVQAKL